MESEHTIERYRNWYRKLLRLYSLDCGFRHLFRSDRRLQQDGADPIPWLAEHVSPDTLRTKRRHAYTLVIVAY